MPPERAPSRRETGRLRRNNARTRAVPSPPHTTRYIHNLIRIRAQLWARAAIGCGDQHTVGMRRDGEMWGVVDAGAEFPLRRRPGRTRRGPKGCVSERCVFPVWHECAGAGFPLRGRRGPMKCRNPSHFLCGITYAPQATWHVRARKCRLNADPKPKTGKTGTVCAHLRLTWFAMGSM